MNKNSNELSRSSRSNQSIDKNFFKKEEKIKSTTSKYNYKLTNQEHIYTYVTESKISESPDTERDYKNFKVDFFAKSFKSQKNSLIRVPSKAKRHLERKIPKKLLKLIDKDKTRAIEICFFILSLIANKSSYEWTRLSSKKLALYTKYGRDNTYIYKHIINALKYSNEKTPPIIEVKKDKNNREEFSPGKESKKYKVSRHFSSNRFIEIELIHKDILTPYLLSKRENLEDISNNLIVKNILQLFPRITYPTDIELKDEAKRLMKLNYHKKGKELIFRKDLNTIVNLSKFMVVEDNIETFKNHIKRGMTSISMSKKAGGRVTYSLNLINSWIRSLIKIDGEEIVEVDFKALHPNLPIKIYQGEQKYITHQIVAEKLHLTSDKVKKDHLSYFNDKIKGMVNRKVHQYYKTYEPKMVERIIEDKKKNDYRVTSKKMFDLEVQIMSKIIEILNSKGVFLIYIYDALACKKSDLELVKSVMEQVVVEFGVYTTTSVNYKYGIMENEKNDGIIYKGTNTITGQAYIGATIQKLEERISDHLMKADKNYNHSFQKAIQEYGKENFKWEQIDTAKNPSELAQKEKYYIEKYDSYQNGYNSDRGGGFKKPIYQFNLNGELISSYTDLESAANAVNASSSTISHACLKDIKTAKGFYWSYTSNFDKVYDCRFKSVNQFDLYGNLIASFDSISRASKATGVNKSSIAKCCRGERKKAGNFIWKISS